HGPSRNVAVATGSSAAVPTPRPVLRTARGGLPGRDGSGHGRAHLDAPPHGTQRGPGVVGQVIVRHGPHPHRGRVGSDRGPARVTGRGEVRPGPHHPAGQGPVLFVRGAADEERGARR